MAHGLKHSVKETVVHNHRLWQGVVKDVSQLVRHQAGVQVHDARAQPGSGKVGFHGLVNVWQERSNARALAHALTLQKGSQLAASGVEVLVCELPAAVDHGELVWHAGQAGHQGIPWMVHGSSSNVGDFSCD